MNKIALIGGKELTKYSVANVLWRIINNTSDKVKFDFSMYELESTEALASFFSEYKSNSDFVGFNVALPWKSEIVQFLDFVDLTNEIPSIINTVYKANNSIHGDNTDILGIRNGLAFSGIKLNNIKDVLVLGLGGAGKATSVYLSMLGMNIYGYDVAQKSTMEGIKICKSIEEIESRKYDLIINATPVGKYYFDKIPLAFESPISLMMLKNIVHETTVIQEMNYFPTKTLLLEMGDQLGLKTVSGVLMLVFQALESYYKYFNVRLSEIQVNNIVKEMVQYANDKEQEIFKLNVNKDGHSGQRTI
jgi:shikimate dehydrogenase